MIKHKTKTNQKPQSLFDIRRIRICNLLNIYINKTHIKMKPIMKSIQQRLSNSKQISLRQFEVIIPYLQNDTKQNNQKLPPQQLIDYFSSIIYGLKDTEYLSEEEYVLKYHPSFYDDYVFHTSPPTVIGNLQYYSKKDNKQYLHPIE